MKKHKNKHQALLLSSLIGLIAISGCKGEKLSNNEPPIEENTGLITAIAGDDGIQVSVEGYNESQGAAPLPITIFASDRKPLSTVYVKADNAQQTLAVANPADISALFLGNTLIINPPQQTELYLNNTGEPTGFPRVILPEPINCFDKPMSNVPFDTSNLAEPYSNQRLWFGSRYADITLNRTGMEVQLCSDLGSPILIDPVNGVFNQLSGSEIDKHIESVSNHIGVPNYVIPSPMALPSANLTIETGWPVENTYGSLVKTVHGKPGLWLQHEPIERRSSDVIVAIPYIPSSDINGGSYRYEITSSANLSESPFGDPSKTKSYDMQKMFGHLKQKFAHSVGDATPQKLAADISAPVPAFPFIDPIEGHGSALFFGERDETEWDMLVMNFRIENSIHAQLGEKYSTIEVLMPINTSLPHQIYVLELVKIMENIGDAYHATSIAVRDYNSVSDYNQAIHEWARKGLSYTEVGLQSEAEPILLTEVEFVDEGMKVCVENTAQANNWLTIADVTVLNCEHIGKNRGFYFENAELGVYGIDSTIDIAQFTHLKELSLRGHYYTSIDVSTLTELTLLNLASSFIQEIDLSQNTKIETLNLTGTVIPTLDLSTLENLKVLYASKNGVGYDVNYHEITLDFSAEYGYDFKITQDMLDAGIVEIILFNEDALNVFER